MLNSDENSVVWRCHPDLRAEWASFSRESHAVSEVNNGSNLWIQFWLQGTQHNAGDALGERDKPTTDNENTICINLVDPAGQYEDTETEDKVELDEHQLRKLNTLVVELCDSLEDTVILPSELHEEISALSNQAVVHLLKILRPQLSEQGVYNLCLSLCNGDSPWVDVSLVFEHIFLCLLSDSSSEPAGAELMAGLLRLTEMYSSPCASELILPLLSLKDAAVKQHAIIATTVPVLLENDFIYLLRNYLDLCSAPLEDWQLSVLTTLICESNLEHLSAGLDSLLHRLLPLLTSSASTFSSSEEFARLLLSIIPALHKNMSSSTHHELSAIAQQNKSFSRKAIMNAIQKFK